MTKGMLSARVIEPGQAIHRFAADGENLLCAMNLILYNFSPKLRRYSDSAIEILIWKIPISMWYNDMPISAISAIEKARY
tara:strand:+ start:1218 stop:1457 length:240 start_codon:yes stop_codon:yes gene_type:complete